MKKKTAAEEIISIALLYSIVQLLASSHHIIIIKREKKREHLKSIYLCCWRLYLQLVINRKASLEHVRKLWSVFLERPSS